ncbi:homoserine dehydrogenase [Sediminivirga luteola]|uniref:NAD-binding homoserine dehydrogenase n=1 Tax=Sediminivirga luteola TaxID=1774748 RepID=A0A8J2TW45_9MICO|nr:homoserine dehydrogenase [Sediminivirga luteola]MCI2265735.1 homoserine dehydrogenase [Sediminivirga luteola]GGA07054.1 NAD-binding homoserine dehydrogenase [Sediminivirga luteola]
MNLEHLLAGHEPQTVRYALTGANGGYARTLIAQTARTPRVAASILCDLDPEAARAAAVDAGLPAHEVVVCSSADAVRQAVSSGHTAVVADAALLDPSHYDILVEATGNPGFGLAASQDALRSRRHVAMVSKEVDSVAGVHLAGLARDHGVVYTPASGDQPANLIALVSWVRTLGLEIVAVGKSSEYDIVYDPETGVATQLHDRVEAPDLKALLELGDDPVATLGARRAALEGLPVGATADYCEMAVVASHTGYRSDTEPMHYPVARIDELAEIYSMREDGGLIGLGGGVVDVFSALRLPGEPSFAGGVFAVVRTHDPETWTVLRGKGHVVSRDGRYACIYLPYHLMGVETPVNLLTTVLLGVGYGDPEPGRAALLAGRAVRDLAAGTVLDMGGHHHDVAGVRAILLNAADVPRNADPAPLYLAAHATLARDVAAGALITLDDLTGYSPELLQAWRAGESLAKEHIRDV